MAKVVTYECNQCGCEVVVTETPETELSPIYCCGMEVMEISGGGKKPSKADRKPVKKTVKVQARKTAKRTVSKTKGPATRKKSSKK